MDKPTPKERVEHILKAINQIKEFISNTDAVDFEADVKLQSAVQYQFLIIGEAIRHIENSILEKYNYPWHIPRTFRNFIIHDYHGVKMERIYFAAQDLDGLERVLKEILNNEF